jgi:uncharacterized membrane protein YhaH (DUF805 family)
MSFQDAVRICLREKYVRFSGRARRSEYWFFFLFTFIVSAVAGTLDTIFGIRYANGTNGPIQNLAGLALLLPSLAVATRRLHDTGKSAWWWLLWIFPPAGFIVFLVFFVMDSEGDNQYGRSPKPLGGAYPPPVAPQY